MKMTIQVPDPVGQEILGLPDRDAFVSSALARALQVRHAKVLPNKSRPTGRRLDPAEAADLQLPVAKSRQRERTWRRANQELLQERFAEQWVVLEGEEVVAHNRDAGEAVEAARRKGVDVPFLFFVGKAQPGVVHIGL